MIKKTSCGGSLVEHAISDEKIHEIKTSIKRALLPTLFFERKKQKTKFKEPLRAISVRRLYDVKQRGR